MKNKRLFKRLVLLIIGLTFLGFGGAFLVSIGIGGDAILVFEQGFARAINVDLGNGVLLLNLLFLVGVFFLDRKMINIGTVIFVILVGPLITIFTDLNIFPTPTSLLNAILLHLVATLFITFGIALYLYANIGYAPFEGIVMAIKKKTKLRFSYIKIANDIILFLVGYLLGGDFGIGSIMTVFLFGPLIDFYTSLLKKSKLLY